ncbi:MAG TPA: hypothetical protein VG795_08875 [Acidimicrobiia bacterium]|nr:hypothetical protein [Acidimicrobiia bacterium]
MLGTAGCGSAGGSDGTAQLPADVAAGLAIRAEQVAAALEAGACDDALAKARSLQTDIATLPAAPEVRAEALAGAARLVSGINCPVTTTTTVPPPPTVSVPSDVRVDGDGRKGKGNKGDKDDD